MKASIHVNSEAPIGLLVERLLEQADDVFIASAYISGKAIDTLTARLQRRGMVGMNVDILFGLDAETDLTSVQRAYDASFKLPQCLRVRYTPHRAGRLFHPKVYYFRCRSTCHILVASANLTEAGHHSNEEMYCYLEVPSTHDVVTQFNAVRSVWLSEPFSAVLDDKIVGAKAGIEYQKEQLKQAEEAFGKIISSVGEGVVIPLPDNLDPLRAALAKGYLIVPSFSLSNLYVSVQDILKPADGTTSVKENQVVIVRNRSSASVNLLPDDIIKKFANLQRTARDLCELYSLPMPSGMYVPQSAHSALERATKHLVREHNALVSSQIKNSKAIDKHLKDKLEEECRNVWHTLNPNESLPFPEELLPEVQKRIKERRKQLEANPSEALRFSFEAFPHPLVLMNEMPGHIAWRLQQDDPDKAVVKAVICLLRGQVELLKGVTQWTKPGAIKRDYERVRLLTAIRGKDIDALLRSVASWMRDSHIKSIGQTSEQKKLQLAKRVAGVKKKAGEHLQWLAETDALAPTEAAKRLLDEYYSLKAQ